MLSLCSHGFPSVSSHRPNHAAQMNWRLQGWSKWVHFYSPWHDVKVSVRYLRRGLVLKCRVKVYFVFLQINFDLNCHYKTDKYDWSTRFALLALTWDQLLCQTSASVIKVVNWGINLSCLSTGNSSPTQIKPLIQVAYGTTHQPRRTTASLLNVISKQHEDSSGKNRCSLSSCDSDLCHSGKLTTLLLLFTSWESMSFDFFMEFDFITINHEGHHSS